MTAHEFITIANRRWCLGCDLYQSKQTHQAWWEPKTDCERYTPYARAQDERGVEEFHEVPQGSK